MTNEILIALAVFAFVSSITPGPNNLMLMASGANFGFRRTIPHMLGIGIGFVAMIFLLGAGLVRVFDSVPVLHSILKTVSVAYLMWLAWRIANAAPSTPGDAAGRPMTFLQAAAFQWVNPKAWTMALTAITVYTPNQSFAAIVLVGLVFGLINLPSVGCWTLLGQQVAKLLESTAHLRAFNWCMAVLLVGSLYPVIWP